jgi:hypothetical protein
VSKTPTTNVASSTTNVASSTTNVASSTTNGAVTIVKKVDKQVKKKEVTGIVGPGKKGFLLLFVLLLFTLAQFFLPLPKHFFDQSAGQYWAMPEPVEQQVVQPSPVNAPPELDEVPDLDEWAF